jgi:hypothetical protein
VKGETHTPHPHGFSSEHKKSYWIVCRRHFVVPQTPLPLPKPVKSYNFIIPSGVNVRIFLFFFQRYDARILYFFVLRSVMLRNDLSFQNSATVVTNRTQIFPIIETQKHFCQLLLKISTFKPNFLNYRQCKVTKIIKYINYLVLIGYRGSFSRIERLRRVVDLRLGGTTPPRPLHDFIALTGTILPFTFATIAQNTTLKNKIRTNFPSNDITV